MFRHLRMTLVFLAEPDLLEAVAQYDFQGRSEREVSFRKGDRLELHEQASTDWWRGSMRGQRGLIPAKYISVPKRSLSARCDAFIFSLIFSGTFF